MGGCRNVGCAGRLQFGLLPAKSVGARQFFSAYLPRLPLLLAQLRSRGERQQSAERDLCVLADKSDISMKRAAPGGGLATARPPASKKKKVSWNLEPTSRPFNPAQEADPAVAAPHYFPDYESSSGDSDDDSILCVDPVDDVTKERVQAPVSPSSIAVAGLPQQMRTPWNSSEVVPAGANAPATLSELKGVDELRRILAECEANEIHSWFSEVEEEYKSQLEDMETAAAIEECTLWNLPDPYTALLGHHLFSKAKLILHKQAKLKGRMVNSGSTLESFRGQFVSGNLQPLPDKVQVLTHNMWVRTLIKLAHRCGSIGEMLSRKDKCSEFALLIIAWRNLRVQDLENTYRSFPHTLFLNKSKTDSDLKNAMKAAGCKDMWKLPKANSDVLGKAVLLRISLQLQLQAVLNDSMTATPLGPPINLVGLSRKTSKKKKTLRNFILKQCGYVARFCGGLQALKARHDYFAKYLDLVTGAFNLTDEELEKKAAKVQQMEGSRPDESAVEKAMCEFATAEKAVRAACAQEQVKKMWRISDVTILGRALLARATVEAESQSFRRNLLRVRKMESPDLEGKLLGKNLRAIAEDVSVNTKRANLALCASLAKKCGGLQQLRGCGDDCSKFIGVSVALYGHKVSELESGRLEITLLSTAPPATPTVVNPLPVFPTPRTSYPARSFFRGTVPQATVVQPVRSVSPNSNPLTSYHARSFIPGGFPQATVVQPVHSVTPNFPHAIPGGTFGSLANGNSRYPRYASAYTPMRAKTQQEIELEKTRKELDIAMIPLEHTELWQLTEPAQIGRFLCARLRNDIAEQEHRLQLLQERGEDASQWFGKLISPDLVALHPSVGQELNKRVQNECWKLSDRFGGMSYMLSQSGPCRDYVQLVSEVFKVEFGV